MKDFELELQKQEESLVQIYPMILNFYYDYINSDEYNKPNIARCANAASELREQKMCETISPEQFKKLEDSCAQAECFHE